MVRYVLLESKTFWELFIIYVLTKKLNAGGYYRLKPHKCFIQKIRICFVILRIFVVILGLFVVISRMFVVILEIFVVILGIFLVILGILFF